MVLPPEANDWVREAGIPQPPTEYDTVGLPNTFGPVAIIDPAPFSYIKGAVTIKGNARDPNFQLYRLDYGKGLNPAEWTQIGTNHFGARYNADLETWDARSLDGLYSLRLTVVRGDNSIQEFVIPVTVDNTPPSVTILYPADHSTYTMGDEYVTIQPNVVDNISMDRVEFYVDGQLIAISTIAPYNERWIITEPGTHNIELRAYDNAGNTSVSQRVTIEVTGQ